MKTDDKLFVDSRPVLGRREDFDLKKLKEVHRDLSDYFRMPVEEISNHYWRDRETVDRKRQKMVEQASTQEGVIEYYKTTRQYLYELMSWEAQKDKQREFKKIHLFCQRFNINKILDFGGGAGGLCIYLNNSGLSCDYLDIPGETYNFADWRFNKHKIKLKLISAMEEGLPSKYGAVVAYDVFEHIFDLPGAIRKINTCLETGGYLISISTFSGGGLHLLKNEIYQDINNFDALLSGNGFQFVGQLKLSRFSRLLEKIGWPYPVFSIRINRKLKHGGNLIIYRKITPPA